MIINLYDLCLLKIHLTCVVVVVDGYCGRVVFSQHGFRGGAGVQRGGADLGAADHAGVTEVNVEILVLLKDVIVDDANSNLWRKQKR